MFALKIKVLFWRGISRLYFIYLLSINNDFKQYNQSSKHRD